jgi:hypothetical protein
MSLYGFLVALGVAVASLLIGQVCLTFVTRDVPVEGRSDWLLNEIGAGLVLMHGVGAMFLIAPMGLIAAHAKHSRQGRSEPDMAPFALKTFSIGTVLYCVGVVLWATLHERPLLDPMLWVEAAALGAVTCIGSLSVMLFWIGLGMAVVCLINPFEVRFHRRTGWLRVGDAIESDYMRQLERIRAIQVLPRDQGVGAHPEPHGQALQPAAIAPRYQINLVDADANWPRYLLCESADPEAARQLGQGVADFLGVEFVEQGPTDH